MQEGYQKGPEDRQDLRPHAPHLAGVLKVALLTQNLHLCALGILMRQDHLKGAADFPSDDGCHDPSGPIPTLDPPGGFAKPPPPGILQGFALAQDSPLGLTFLHGHGKARPQHSKTKSPSALSRFLNRYSWPTRALIRLARKEAQEALDRARVSEAKRLS